MNLGIIGLPQVGKRTIFSILTGISAERAPSRAGIRYGTAPVHDPRIDRLTAIFEPKRTRYAEFEISLPPDIQPDAARAADWLEPLRRVDALLHVVRAFDAPDVFHVLGSTDPARDLITVDTELLFADLALVETRLARVVKEKMIKQSNANLQVEEQLLQRCREQLEQERPLRELTLGEHETELMHSLQFLTLKPLILVLNTGEQIASAVRELTPLVASLEQQGVTVVLLSAPIEFELAELDPDERDLFMTELGIDEPAAHRLSRAAYECLGLLSFFTVGSDEVRAWPVGCGALAPEAAGRIHSDLERGFIRADTIAYMSFMDAGSEKEARQQSLYRLQGKDYEVQDGDIMEIRFSV